MACPRNCRVHAMYGRIGFSVVLATWAVVYKTKTRFSAVGKRDSTTEYTSFTNKWLRTNSNSDWYNRIGPVFLSESVNTLSSDVYG